jgi:hypothetical protein
MRPAQAGDIYEFVRIQSELLTTLMSLYPEAKDLTWLLDFPPAGTIELNNEEWTFIKHGAGIRFVRSVDPRLVIDAHKNISNMRQIDDWRIIQFLESANLQTKNIHELFNDMINRSELTKMDNAYYVAP